ncbi:argonaute/piwi family protein [Pedobacter insulae]|uniref:Protein argonaute n=1 Tax=Pedobacter insulae TaxID=414048 RepID=A0A1I2ZGP1_9SPHI|nr:hypothetical protein [Pedobacter insulae]SFH36983.1 hypothetical protein SAMN04489864_11016 [Pedobacter insulae]
MKQETVIFPINNLHLFTSDYVLYEICGMNDNDEDYDSNIQFIVKSLSYKLKHPVTAINKENKPFLVIRNENEIIMRVPEEYIVKRDVMVCFKKLNQVFRIDFLNYDESTKNIILRFLQFDIQSELNKNRSLWQPGSGDAFYNENPIETFREVAIYNGFYVRVVELPTKGFGLAIDVTKKYVSSQPLDVRLTRKQFKEQDVRGSHLVYQYGSKKYEIRADQYSDLTASQYKYLRPTDGVKISLLQDTQEKFGKSMPPEVAALPDDAAVLIYKNNDGEERRIIAGLCYKVYDTEDPIVSKLHKKSIIIPFYRRRFIRAVRNRFLKKLMFGNLSIDVSELPLVVDKKKFIVPDYLFGKNTTVSVRNTSNAINVSVNQLGRKRKSLLLDGNVGFYTNATFQAQYFIIPQTVHNMYANHKYFLNNLITQVNKMHPTEEGWSPTVITYDDRNKRNVVEIGFEIIQKVAENVTKKGGYAVIMLPTGIARVKRQHDDLAALVVSECHEEHGITSSIMHSDTLKDCYEHKTINGQSTYVVKQERRGKYTGYVDGVAINQVLLNNERWPYILNSPLNGDLTIGIDVKKKLAGFTFVDKFSKNILTRFDKSDNKERLSHGQVVKMLVGNISYIANRSEQAIEKIVIHRDGRLFKPEKEGILEAIRILKNKGILPTNSSVNFVEIPKHSIMPFRLFDVQKDFDIYKITNDNGLVQNPEVGTYTIMNSKEAFICTTGKEFQHGGSSNPLYIKCETEGMTIEEVLEDIYMLSCLAYTKPDDCSRFPITIKITDRRINTLGSEYDEEHLDILKAVHN